MEQSEDRNWNLLPRWRAYTSIKFAKRKIQEKGLVRCLSHWFAYFIELPLAILLWAILVALRPLLHIRIGRLWCERLAVFASLPEIYLCEKDARMHPRRTWDIWYHWDRDKFMLKAGYKLDSQTCNSQLDRMWRRVIHVQDAVSYLDRLNRLISPNGNAFTIPLANDADILGLMSIYPPHISFTDAEEELGWQKLAAMGIGKHDKFVCFHARDSAYLESARPRNEEKYGDWRWQDYRDSSIVAYMPAVERLAEIGYFAIRMGKVVKDRLEVENPRIIDYASFHHSDFMDVFLAAKCDFFIAQGSGINRLPMLFRKPLVYVNMSQIWDVQDGQYDTAIITLKKYYSDKLGRFMTYRELLDLGIGRFKLNDPAHQKIQKELQLHVMENTSEEILDATTEMVDRLNNTFIPSEEASILQSRLLSLIREYPEQIPVFDDAPKPIFASAFLLNNRDLLD